MSALWHKSAEKSIEQENYTVYDEIGEQIPTIQKQHSDHERVANLLLKLIGSFYTWKWLKGFLIPSSQQWGMSKSLYMVQNKLQGNGMPSLLKN